MQEATEVEASLRGQANIRKYMFGFVDSMALKCAVELRIADIIHSHSPTDGASNSKPMITLSQLASSIAPSPDMTYLTRIMRLLVHRNIFAIHHPSDGGEPLYGLTHSSRWLLHNAELSLAPMLVMENHPCLMAPWHYFGQCVKKGGPYAFKMAHGLEIWDYASQNPEFNKLFNDGMACTARVVMKAILTGYEHGFDGVGSLVDVGGGTGSAVAEIVKSYPNIKGFNFDLPHVVATAPLYHGVSHVGGDMFEGSIPNADAVFMKVSHHKIFYIQVACDSDCIKILKNCRKAIPEKSGKIIIVDIVLEPNGEGILDDTRLVFDLLMIAHTPEGGFPRHKVIKIPALASIVEAYPM
ncbi:(R-S)-reticuline 7-O-methyltransferase-like [Pyrus ussuriensis x Pyrus communis]|uniref:(R-S)-reticuline 7-O-methyltransferase-like n=1 Tax=Pyrus ussuriensis x Pyrus communis TaxID=2448454 RepID=A0A5N5GM35_9ROSA|nr:(R-S)-reticuline 7-O-methyltransferase-like [Pyrus ussuriensis x Pyrus communis]